MTSRLAGSLLVRTSVLVLVFFVVRTWLADSSTSGGHLADFSSLGFANAPSLPIADNKKDAELESARRKDEEDALKSPVDDTFEGRDSSSEVPGGGDDRWIAPPSEAKKQPSKDAFNSGGSKKGTSGKGDLDKPRTLKSDTEEPRDADLETSPLDTTTRDPLELAETPSDESPMWKNLTDKLPREPPLPPTLFFSFRNVCIAVPNSKWQVQPEVAFVDRPDSPPSDAEVSALSTVLTLAVLNTTNGTKWPHLASKPTFVPGKTFLPNCRWGISANPAHLLFATSITMAWARSRPPLDLVPQFDTVSLLWCPDYRRFRFEWDAAKVVTGVAFADWPKAKLLPDLSEKRFPISRGVTCFEELYAADRFGVLAEPADEKPFLSALSEKDSKIRQVLEEEETVADQLESRCQTNSLRIAVWNREKTWKSRSATNMPDLLESLANLTSTPVVSITANASTSTLEHVKLFNSWDVLISSVGSQLWGLVFSNAKKKKAVVEIGVCVRSHYWKHNAEWLGFSYAYSLGHTPAEKERAKVFKEEGQCRWKQVGKGPEARLCERKFWLTDVSFEADVDKVVQDVKWTIGELCSKVGVDL